MIQHSAGSGNSNSIAWLAHQLIGLEKDDAPVFDSIIVVTDRVILDRQIRDTIKQYAQVPATVEHADRSGDLLKQLITETIPARVAADTAFRNARVNSDRQNARIEHDKALLRVMTGVMKDDTELFKRYMDDKEFRRDMTDAVFKVAYEAAAVPKRRHV